MAFTPKPRVAATASAPGTGTFTLTATVTGYQGWSAVADGSTAPYYAEALNADGTLAGGWEEGGGTVGGSGTTLARTTIRASSNGGSAVNFTGLVRIVLGAGYEDLAWIQLANTFTAAQTIQLDSLGTGVTDGLIIANTAAAVLGAQQNSPFVYLRGNGWSTTDGDSKLVLFRIGVEPTQSVQPVGDLAIYCQIGSGAMVSVFTLSSTGKVAASSFTGGGGNITDLNADNFSSGTMPDARLSSNVVLENISNTFTADQTINGDLAVTGGVTAIGVTSTGSITLQNNGTAALFISSYGTSVEPYVSIMRGRGTQAAPSAVQATDVLLNILGQSYYNTTSTAYGFQVLISAHENWDATHHGTQIRIRGVSDGATSLATWLQLDNAAITVGTWNASVIGPGYGGTGIVNNAASTITISGAFALTLTLSAATGVTLPTSGTLATLAGSESLTNKKLGSLTSNGYVKTSGGDGTLSVDTSTFRVQLTAARTYYVRTDGSDSNDGLTNSSGGAFLTIQKAVDVASALDNGGFDITIQLVNTSSPSTWTTGATLKSFVGSGQIIILGDETTPSNIVINPTSAHCFTIASVLGIWHLKGMQLKTTTSGSGINATGVGVLVRHSNMDFNACVSTHITATYGASVSASANYTVSSGSFRHWYTFNGNINAGTSITVTLTGTPAWGTAGVQALGLGFCNVSNITYSGAATGKRYDVAHNSVIYSNGVTIPGNVAGTEDGFGKYF